MWWKDVLWSLWNDLTAWIALGARVVNAFECQRLYDDLRGGSWYDFGFLVVAGSPFLGMFSESKNLLGWSSRHNVPWSGMNPIPPAPLRPDRRRSSPVIGEGRWRTFAFPMRI